MIIFSWNVLSRKFEIQLLSTVLFLLEVILFHLLIDYIWKYEKVYHKYMVNLNKKIFVITWPIWTDRNNIIFRNLNVQPTNIITSTVNLFDDMMHYNIMPRIFGQDGKPPSEGWTKINVDAPMRLSMRSTSIYYIMRDNRANVIMAKSKRMRDCHILTECETIREAILTAIQNSILQSIIQNDSQLVVNAISERKVYQKIS